MLIYSETTKAFILKVQEYLKLILEKEMGLTYKRTRILHGEVFYPLSIVIFEKKETLAYYDHRFYQLGLNKKLIMGAKETLLKNILRHELAHLYQNLTSTITTPHDIEFRNLCRRFGWGEEVYHATADIALENSLIEGELPFEKVHEKIKKLMNLAQSSNLHEAELATIKANELLLKYNIERLQDDHNESVVVTVLESTKVNAKMTAISSILETFFVFPILHHGKGLTKLDVIGERGNTILAEYVATFLDRHFELLWESERVRHQLKGQRAKNSFFKGVAKGYTQKIEEASKICPDLQSYLPVIKKNLQVDVSRVYGRLSYRAMGGKTDYQSEKVGIKNGRELSIHRPVESSKKMMGRLEWF